QGIARSQHGELPGERLPGGSLPRAVRGTAHLDPALAHRARVGREIVALHDDEPESPAPIQKVDETALGAGREVPRSTADPGELEIVVAVEGDGVVGAPAAADAARIDVEAEPAVGLDALVEAGRTDHHVVDAGQHRPATVTCAGRTRSTRPLGGSAGQARRADP